MGIGAKLLGLGMTAVLLAASMPAEARPGRGGGHGGGGHGGGGHGYGKGGYGHGGHGGYRYKGSGYRAYGYRGYGHGGYRYGGYAYPRYGYPVYSYPAYGYYHNHFDWDDFLLGAVIAGGIAAIATSSARDHDEGEVRSERSSTGEEDAAATACATAAQRQARRLSSNARVVDIGTVTPDGDGWRVEGVVAIGDQGSDQRNFQCGVRSGRVDFVQLGNELAVR